MMVQAAFDLSERVVARIRALGENGSPESIKKLEDQLEKCFEIRKQDLLLSVEPSNTNFFTFETTKARRQWKEIKDLVQSCGTHEELFKSMTTYIRELYATTGDSMLCSLRYELIMAAHDAGIESLVKSDPCHDFAWCLEACMRDKHLESHQTARLRHMLDAFLKSPIEVCLINKTCLRIVYISSRVLLIWP
ncbi:unnamed protein product [Cylicostephanus goldi]|uniref:Uncharacterized protein n=1 Tax=Cylicostephanus goldi TaxID=71465 RepID=A0A3P7MMX9_CYLGO|nr:unnamed protein product [Cylicostephanus goldi]